VSDDPGAHDFAELLDWIEGRLAPTEAALVADRVRRGGDEARATVEWLRSFVLFARDNTIPEPPPMLRQRLRQSFEDHFGRGRPLVRYLATQSFDSRSEPTLVGVRGGDDDETGLYQLAFTTPVADVVIDVAPVDPEHLRLDGQVLQTDRSAPMWEAALNHPAGSIADRRGDLHGSFSLVDVPVADSQLFLTNGYVQIAVRLPLAGTGG